MAGETLSYGLAFLAGLVTFVSPCCLPLVPTYVTYLTGSSFDELASGSLSGALRRRITVNAVAFILGFSVFFIALGVTASAVGGFLRSNIWVVRQISAVIVVAFGLHMMGFLRLPFLDREMRVTSGLPGSRSGLPRSFLTGAAFSAGWSPCVGPVLTSILVLAGQADTALTGAKLLAVYSLGLGLPFFLVALSMRWFTGWLPRVARHLPKVRLASGALMVTVGLMIFLDLFTVINKYFNLNAFIGL